MQGGARLAVDVGCGTGMSTRNLFGKFDRVVGVDLSEAMIEEARNCFKDHSEVEFSVARAEEIPVEDNSAQVVLVGRAIHYFDQKTFFKEVDRILVRLFMTKLWQCIVLRWSTGLLPTTASTSPP